MEENPQPDATIFHDDTRSFEQPTDKAESAAVTNTIGGYENAAYVPDCASGSTNSSESFVQELQQYRLVSANGYHHPPSASGSTAVQPKAWQSGQQQQQQLSTELSLLGSVTGASLSSIPTPPTGILKPLPIAPVRRPGRATSRLDAMPPETKLRLQRLLRQNAGVLRHDATSVLLGVYNIAPGQMTSKELDKRFSAVAMEMLREQEDRDLHPFGRGGRFEGVLYSRRVKVQVDHTKFLAWIVFASFILLTSGAIIFLAEMERRQKGQQISTSKTSTTIDVLFHASNRTG